MSIVFFALDNLVIDFIQHAIQTYHGVLIKEDLQLLRQCKLQAQQVPNGLMIWNRFIVRLVNLNNYSDKPFLKWAFNF